jgi:hypothetical protein
MHLTVLEFSFVLFATGPSQDSYTMHLTEPIPLAFVSCYDPLHARRDVVD